MHNVRSLTKRQTLLTTSFPLPAQLLEEREKREKWSKLRERDVATSVMGLQKQLHAEDFEKIFSRKNPRIGER